MAQPIQKVPVELINQILSELGSLRQLCSAISSHRIFLDAYDINRRSVLFSIVTSRVPRVLLPFALALLESTRAGAAQEEQARGILTRLNQSVADPTDVQSRLRQLSASDFLFIYVQSMAVKSLRNNFTNRFIRQMTYRNMRIRHSAANVSSREIFRIDTALFRFQLLVNLFCNNDALHATCGPLFFHDIVPRATEQLMCTYFYLAANVEWGRRPFQYT